MKKLKWLLIAIVGLQACASRPDRALTRAQANKFLFHSKTLMLKATLASIYDPYNGGDTYFPSQAIKPTLLVFTDGSFVKYDTHNYTEGNWYIEKGTHNMAFIHQRENFQDIPPAFQDSAFRYIVQKASPDTLIIAQQGRHGMVSYTYCLSY